MSVVKKTKLLISITSIIILTHIGKNYFACEIDATLNQTYKNIEAVVIKDGSKEIKK